MSGVRIPSGAPAFADIFVYICLIFLLVFGLSDLLIGLIINKCLIDISNNNK